MREARRDDHLRGDDGVLRYTTAIQSIGAVVVKPDGTKVLEQVTADRCLTRRGRVRSRPMGAIERLLGWISQRFDRIDERIDKPAKSHGTFLQGSEVMVDNKDTPKESGQAVQNKHSGFGRR